jgi:small subunit ribosomal protein S3
LEIGNWKFVRYMGQKVNPKIIRIGVIRSWPSKWYCGKKDFARNLEQDVRIRKFLTRELREAGVDKVEIERNARKIGINVHTAKPGLIIGRGGKGIEDLKKKVKTQFLKLYRMNEITLNITEVARPNLSAQIIVQSMAIDIEKRVPFRKVMKQAINKVERAGAQGVKVLVKGRLNGAEIAREEKLSTGKVPLHTLRADIDYARGTAFTTYGAIGVRAWIYKGEVFEKETEEKGGVIGKGK